MGLPKFIPEGTRFGRLVVIHCYMDSHKNWTKCLCDCGRSVIVSTANVKNGHTQSCGCLQRERTAKANTTHGLKRVPEYNSWSNMIKRVTNKSDAGWENYGGRGITVCAEWRHDFAAFLAHIGPKPSPEHTLDRIDVNGNYEPGNVRWATRSDQIVNQRPRRVSTQCQRGHDLLMYGRIESKNGRLRCGECERIGQNLRRKAQREQQLLEP